MVGESASLQNFKTFDASFCLEDVELEKKKEF